MYAMEDIMSTIEDKIAQRVGRAIKERREALGLALRSLAAKSGISASMISDIERGAKSPTISTLSQLADALGVPMSTLVDAPRLQGGRIQILRRGERQSIRDPATGATRESLGPALLGSKVEFLSFRVPARRTAGPFAAHARGTIEHLHLAAGAIRVVFGDDVAEIKAGDSCSCIADAPHLFDNAKGKREALIYLVIEGGAAETGRPRAALRA
jgi:transcriptional regulator with XRE-family HTH domain